MVKVSTTINAQWLRRASLIWLVPGFLLLGCEAQDVDEREENTVINFLTAQGSGQFAQVKPGIQLQFPKDHAAHTEFRQEWWYFNGNLQSDNGQRYGFHLTFFRFAQDEQEQYAPSGWRHSQSYMAHYSITDIANATHYSYEDYARGAQGLAGGDADPFNVWLNNWYVRETSSECDDCFRLKLNAERGGHNLRLNLLGSEQPVLHGSGGYSQKDRLSDTASYYYSYPALVADGTLMIGGQRQAVSGSVWMDHEWSSKVLQKGQTGWDWFGLTLDSGASLMLFRLRQQQGDDYLAGTYITDSGATVAVDAGDIELRPVKWWHSDASGTRYPVAWEISIRSLSLALDIRAEVEDQEFDHSFRYWEGAVRIMDSNQSDRLMGRGYMELTGY